MRHRIVRAHASVESAASTTDNELSCPTHARRLPDGEKATACTQPPPPLLCSMMSSPNLACLPQGVGGGADSTSFTNAEKTRVCRVFLGVHLRWTIVTHAEVARADR